MSTTGQEDVDVVEREPTAEEIQQALTVAREQGLPEQFHVQWDETGRKFWMLKSKRFHSVPSAMAHACQIGLLPPAKMPESYQDKELSPKELEAALREARQQGLPESFTCRWDNKKRRRVWYTPDGRRVKGGIPAALKTAAELGLISNARAPTDSNKIPLTTHEKIQVGLQEARAHGLEGWNVIWDSKYNQKVFCSPDGARNLYGLDKALAYAVKQKWLPADKLPPQFAKDRELTNEEKAKAWKAAKKKNLPETWTVVWDSKQHRRVWVAPDNRRCDCISKAVVYSVKKGWLDPTIVKPQKTSLTPAEEEAALMEAKERGLPDCFSVRWNPKKNQKQWIAPQGKVCNSIPAALAYATKHELILENDNDDGPVAAMAPTKRKRKQTRIISPRPLKQAALTQLIDAALAKDVQESVPQTAHTNAATAVEEEDVVDDGDDNVVNDIDEGDIGWTKFQDDQDDDDDNDDNGVNDDIKPADSELAKETASISGAEETTGKTSMSKHEVDIAMEQAELRGLPGGWTVSWDLKRKRRMWTSPCGKYKCRGIPSALHKSMELGLISYPSTPVQDASQSVSTDARAASAMRDAKHRGLPDSWTVEFLDDGRRSLRWRSPDGRVAKTLVEALKMSVAMGILPPDKMPVEYRERTLTAEEEERSLKEAASRGLPSGWSVTWNSSRRQKIWISPDGKKKCDSINKALKVSVRLGLISQDALPARLKARDFTQEQIDAALADARAKGLTCDGEFRWRLELNTKKGCRRWISPDNKRRCDCISKAVAYSKKMGWVPADSSKSYYS
ncbi:unnamed protein product [Cylindrotheca closterium]|uniref:Uncharacterized protein n=1 Tax=Cylindrotheca closterium TaxID=2856 RepID=A0AAD2FJK3_9STRA|nr:unnamed protein product [Cylindrotheca closterium]